MITDELLVNTLRRRGYRIHPPGEECPVDRPATRTGRNHPDTSMKAAEAVFPKSGTQRRAVLDTLSQHPDGLTDPELCQLLGLSPNSERPRRGELVAMGLVVDSGGRKRISGNDHIVWTRRLSGIGETA